MSTRYLPERWSSLLPINSMDLIAIFTATCNWPLSWHERFTLHPLKLYISDYTGYNLKIYRRLNSVELSRGSRCFRWLNDESIDVSKTISLLVIRDNDQFPDDDNADGCQEVRLLSVQRPDVATTPGIIQVSGAFSYYPRISGYISQVQCFLYFPGKLFIHFSVSHRWSTCSAHLLTCVITLSSLTF